MKTFSTRALAGVRVVGGKKGTRRIGKVRHFVFHPTEKRCIGFLVKRPDILWMVHQKDLFVSIQSIIVDDGRILLTNQAENTVAQVCKKLGVEWNDCVLWVGLPLIDEDEDTFGFVGDVEFAAQTGVVCAVSTDSGVTANALLGKRTIPADMILGFRKGIGSALALTGQGRSEDEDVVHGAILVSKAVTGVTAEGGLAEKAGKSSAVALGKVEKAADSVKEKMSEAAKKTENVVNQGAYSTGKQIKKTKGMFSAFKDEYEKARHDDK